MIDKIILIVNGKPRAGKDTFASLLNQYASVYKYSIIDKVKAIAIDCGWTGGKTERDRKFLSDLKMLTTEYSDMSFNDILEKIGEFYDDKIKEDILIIDMRESDDIERLMELCDVTTVFIENDNVPDVISNEADANVYDFNYDYYISNNGTIEEFRANVEMFYFLLCMDYYGGEEY